MDAHLENVSLDFTNKYLNDWIGILFVKKKKRIHHLF